MSDKTVVYSKKVLLLGSFGVGKTSLVRKFVYKIFEDKYLSTIGVQIYRHILSDVCKGEKANEQLKLILWDLANIEKFTSTSKNYFTGASAAIVVFDLTHSKTLDERKIYLKNFLEINPKAKFIFSGNKIDLIDRDAFKSNQLSEISEIAEKYNAPFFLTSAKTGENVDLLFEKLGKLLLGCS